MREASVSNYLIVMPVAAVDETLVARMEAMIMAMAIIALV